MFIGSSLMFSDFYQFYVQNSPGALPNPQQNICKKLIENWAFHDFLVMVYWKCMFVDFLIEYIDPPDGVQ